jgi:diguanylate cyclase (GGDEF)-like protein
VDNTSIPEPTGWEDPITGLEGPVFWQRVLVAEVARATKYGRDLAVVVLAIDGLDRPDILARAEGRATDRHVLRQVAQCLRREARASDYCTRIGSSRFGVVLTETDEIEAINFVERVREALPALLGERGAGLRFAFGWASPKRREAPDSLVRRAERRLIGELTA